MYDGAIRERELGDVQVGPVTLILATARGGAFAGELAHGVALRLIYLL